LYPLLPISILLAMKVSSVMTSSKTSEKPKLPNANETYETVLIKSFLSICEFYTKRRQQI
jgi:hypothetical protein